MVRSEIINKIIERLLMKIDKKDQEWGRFLVHDEFEEFDSQVNIWAIRDNIRDLKETTVTDLEEFPDIEVKVTFAPPNFFSDVINGKNVPYWQIATVIRLLRASDIIFDPKGVLQKWLDASSNIEWDPKIIDLKCQTSQLLLERMKNRIYQDMIADAYIWLLKAAEEALCVPLMRNNAFKIGTSVFVLDAIRDFDRELYNFYTELLRIHYFSPDKLEKARIELERLADHLYQKNINTDREMWILAAFVSINESERRLNQSIKVSREKRNQNIHIRLFEAAVAELFNGFFLVAQNPRLEVKLDPWVVSSFWNWFGFEELNEKWLMEQANSIKDLLK
jgi:hypothetical protein